MSDDLEQLIKECKKVQTYNSYKQPNGWLLEIFSDADKWTEKLKGQVYLTVVAAHNHKGFHVHAKAIYHFICLKGKIKSVIYSGAGQRREVEIGGGEYKAIKVLPGEAHCMVNSSDEEALMLTYRYPSWSPEDPDILTVSPSEIDTPEAWEKIDYFNRLIKR